MQQKIIDDLVKLFVDIARSTWDNPREEPHGPWPVYYGPEKQWNIYIDHERTAKREAAIRDSQPFSTGGILGY